MHAAFFFIPFSDREWKTVNPDSDSKCNHPSWRKKMILDFCRLLNCSNFCFLCFLWICTMIWFYSSLPKGKKKRLTCVTFGILCFNGFALCPVFLRDNTTVSHVCATDLKISQLWALLALRFIILGHAVCDSYSCIGSLLKQGPPPLPLPTLYIFADGREGQSLISQCDNPGYFNYVYLSNTDYKGYSIERNVTWKMFIP